MIGIVDNPTVSCRAKLYSIKLARSRKLAAAGVKRRIAKRELSHLDYTKALFLGRQKSIRQMNIRSHKHRLFTVQERKSALNNVDTKRFVLPCRICTRALGHIKNTTT
jgi:hypothetical protein